MRQNRFILKLISISVLLLFFTACDDRESGGFDSLLNNSLSNQLCDDDWYDSEMEYYSSSGASTYHYFYPDISSNTGCSAELSVTLYGDFDSTSEYAEVYINGDYVGRVGDTSSASYCSSFSETFTINSSDLQDYLDDGEIFIEVDNTSGVSATSYCSNYHSVELTIGD